MLVYWAVYSGTGQRKTSKLRVTGLGEGNSPMTGEFPAQRTSKAGKCFHLMTSCNITILLQHALVWILDFTNFHITTSSMTAKVRTVIFRTAALQSINTGWLNMHSYMRLLWSRFRLRHCLSRSKLYTFSTLLRSHSVRLQTKAFGISWIPY